MEPQQRRSSPAQRASERVKRMQKSPRNRSYGGFYMEKQAQFTPLGALAPAFVAREGLSSAENFT